MKLPADDPKGNLKVEESRSAWSKNGGQVKQWRTLRFIRVFLRRQRHQNSSSPSLRSKPRNHSSKYTPTSSLSHFFLSLCVYAVSPFCLSIKLLRVFYTVYLASWIIFIVNRCTHTVSSVFITSLTLFYEFWP